METFVYDELLKREKDDWWFVGRRKIIKSLLDAFLVKKKNLSIADIGCGTGDVMSVLANYGQVVGVDNDRRMVRFNKKKGRKVFYGDIAGLTFPNNDFDLITACEVLEHLANDKQALAEIYRVLKPGGYFLLTVPAFQFLWGSHDIVAHHQRRYTREEIKRKLTFSGFTIVKDSYMNTFLFPVILFVRLLKRIFRIGEDQSDFFNYPQIVNQFLRQIFSFEAKILNRHNFPFGVSLIAIARKNEEVKIH